MNKGKKKKPKKVGDKNRKARKGSRRIINRAKLK